MKKIITLSFGLLFLSAAIICNAQQIMMFLDDYYVFPDENEMITSDIDYKNIFVVFSKNITDASIIQFEEMHPALTKNKDKSFPWHNYRLYSLEQSIRSNPEAAESYLSDIRVNPDINAAYPAFLRNGETAYLDNLLLLNILKEDASTDKVIKLIEPFNGSITEELDLIRSTTFAISVPAYINIFTACTELHELQEVIYAQPNFHFYGTVDFIPNDPMLSDQWFLNQSSDADIDATEAWDITTGSSSIAVAVIDGHGFDLNHAEMTGKYLSPYNAVDDNNNPAAIESQENHGTPCAGLIGALSNNSVGVASVGYNVKVVPIKMGYGFGAGGTFQTSELILTRACEHVMTAPYGIVAVSNSYTLGSWANIAVVRDAFSNMRTDSRGGLGTVVLASTGNDNIINAVNYPFHFTNVVGVGSTDSYDSRSSFSNYGDSTDIAAPGTDTWTIDRTGIPGYSFTDYYEFGGTSAACPIAAGIIGLIGSVNPGYTELQLRTQLYNSCEKVGGYSYTNNPSYPFETWSIQLGYGRVNAFLAVQGGGSPLNSPTNLVADVSGNNVHLSWTAPSGGGGVEDELIYDNNTSTGGYKYPGYSMSTHMSPSGPCQILTLKYYTTTEGADKQFYAKIFNWAGSQPGTDVLYNSTETALDGEWVEVDVTGAGINVSGDFVVGFGSFAEEAYIAYDENLNNGRSWDMQESSQTWSSWEEAYLIRAVVLYPSGKLEVLEGSIPDVITKNTANTSRVETAGNISNTVPIPNQFNKLMGLLGYKVFRNGTALNTTPYTDVFYDDNGLAGGTYNYTVTAWYDEGESDPAGPVQAVIAGGSLDPPTNLEANVSGNTVNLTWTAPSGGGGVEDELIYDNNTSTGSYSYPGYSMSTHMSPSGPCQILTLKYYTTTGGGANQFYAKVFNWAGSQPGTDVLHNSTENALNGEWVEVDVTGEGINVSGDFVVGFGSFTDEEYIGYDENLNNGRSWDMQESSQTWSSWDEAYLIRAVVLYPSGKTAVLGGIIPEIISQKNNNTVRDKSGHLLQNILPIPNQYPRLLGLLGYNLYRNGTALNTTPIANTYYSDDGLAAGTYNYTVTAWYDEGESDPAGPVQAVIAGGSLDPPTNLQANVSGNSVNLSWTAAGGGGSTEELIYDNNTATGGYTYTGYSLSTHMSPSGPCQVLALKYYTTTEGSANQFYAKVFNWAGSQPGTDVLYNSTEVALNGDWVEVDVTGAGINVSGDFVVGFGSFTEEAFLGYDQNLNNGRSWDLQESSQTWTSWEEAYLIRAVVLYPSGKIAVLGGNIPETVSQKNNNTMRNERGMLVQNSLPIPNQFHNLLGLLGYKVYRDGTSLNTSPITNTYYNDNGLAAGTYNYTVTAWYDEGESSPAGPVQATVSGSELDPPTNLNGNSNNDEVNLWWISPGGGSQEELIYDNNESDDGYTYPGFTMSTHMSPSDACQILSIKYLLSFEDGDNSFYARIFRWDGSQPGGMIYDKEMTATDGWNEVNVSMDNIFLTDDFVVGFGSENDNTFLAFDANLDNGRSWDRNGATSIWTTWNEAYLIRAVVQYGNGSVSEIGVEPILPELPETRIESFGHHTHGTYIISEVADPIDNQSLNLRGFLGYNMYRNNTQINANLITSTFTYDVLPTFGSYDYNVTAVYDEGESAYSNTLTISYNLGLDEFGSANVKVYPNPASDKLYISSDFTISKVDVLSMDGRVIISNEPGSKEFQIDVDRLDSGLYIVKLETEKGHAALKIVVD